MATRFPIITLARHGQTEWSAAGKHTGLTDLPLTPAGEDLAHALQARLAGTPFAAVFTSPLVRVSRTAELAGFPDATVDDDLKEWNYGDYEGLTTAEIRLTRPDWELFRDGCPNGEDAAAVTKRADRIIEKIREFEADVLVFASGHLLRTLAARWLGEPASLGRLLALDTGSISHLSYYHALTEPCLKSWNTPAKS